MKVTTPTPEMRELIDELRIKYRIFWYSDSLANHLDAKILGKDGGIPMLKREIKAIQQGIDEYRKALCACGRQLRKEAAEIYSIPDLPMRIKDRMVRMGCRTRMDVHLSTLYVFNTKGWGRKSEAVLREWKDRHWSSDYAKDKEVRDGST